MNELNKTEKQCTHKLFVWNSH